MNDPDPPECKKISHEERLAVTLYRCSIALWSAAIRGRDDTLFDEMRTWYYGDLVIEISALSSKKASLEEICCSIGFIVASDGSFNYIINKLSDGKEHCWKNAEFVKVPKSIYSEIH